MGFYPKEDQPIRGISLVQRIDNDNDVELVFQGDLWKERFSTFLSSCDPTNHNYTIKVLLDVGSTYGPGTVPMWWPYPVDDLNKLKLI